MGYNFHINALGFNKAPTEDHPYQRQTAPFRKDQFDTSSSPGDQSLTGWWTRGQLSFHHGAGVKYYEVSEGDGVLNRYDDSSSVDPFTAGEVSLLPAVSDMSVAASDVVPGSLSHGGGVFALGSAGVKFVNSGGSTDIVTSDGVAPTSITSNGSLVFVTNGDKVEVQTAGGSNRHNYVPDPSFHAAVNGDTDITHGQWRWIFPGQVNTTATISRQRKSSSNAPWLDSPLMDYGWCYEWGGLNNPDVGITIDVPGLTIGKDYKVSVMLIPVSAGPPGGPSPGQHGNGLDGGGRPVMRVQMTDEAGTPVVTGGTSADTTAPDVWQEVTFIRTAAATTEHLNVWALPNGNATDWEFSIREVMVVEAPYTGAYFDGSTRGGSWTGLPNDSASQFATIGDGSAFAALATLDTGSFVGCWWGKGRIWAVDDAGQWYAVAADTLGQMVTAASDSFWKSRQPGKPWSFTDSPGAVYLSNGFDVYALTVATDGSVPVVGTPTTASQVPLGESIAAMAFYLSYLILATTAGVRVVEIQGSQSVMSSLIVKGDFTSCKRIGLYDTNAYVAGKLAGRAGATVLCGLDLVDTVADLQPSWAPMWTITELSSDASGCVVDPLGVFYMWGAAGLYASGSSPMASGWLTTGFHRFGTLDTKLFYSVLVRTSGDGTVKVESVAADGTAATLGTVAAGVDAVLGMGMPDPAERVALRFTLSSSGASGPTLLGYQLKALPSPSRQRLLQVPLMLFDHERPAAGRATGGAAWDRLDVLEALEKANALVSFTDGDTGESGTALIEQTTVTQTNPPGGGSRSNGFGGLLVVVLRKL